MMSYLHTSKAVTALTLSLLAFGAMHLTSQAADSIGINFVQEDGVGKLSSEEGAGLDDHRQKHWNSMTVTNDDANGHNNSGALTDLVDSNGDKVKKMRVDVTASPNTQVFPTKGVGWNFTGNNEMLIKAMISPSPSISVSDIPYKKYDVYVYAGQGAKGGHAKGTILGKGGTFGKDPITETKFLNFNWTEGEFVEGGAKDLEESKVSVPSNYFRFRGLRGPDFTFDFDGRQEGGGWAGVAAIQIVEIK